MAKKVLVAYGSRYGATAEIAEKIGETLNKEGLESEVLEGDRVPDPKSYDAYVVGSASYIGQWRKEIVGFVNNNEELLASKPTWLFTSGPTGEGDVDELMQGWKYPPKLKPVIDHISPKDITVFHGAADPAKLNFFFKFVLKGVKAPTGDFRKWDVIENWAKGIAAELNK